MRRQRDPGAASLAGLTLTALYKKAELALFANDWPGFSSALDAYLARSPRHSLDDRRFGANKESPFGLLLYFACAQANKLANGEITATAPGFVDIKQWLQQLVAKGASANALVDNNHTPATWLARIGDWVGLLPTVAALGARMDVPNDDGNLPLLWSCQMLGYTHFQVASIAQILDLGAAVNQRNDRGLSALHLICGRLTSFCPLPADAREEARIGLARQLAIVSEGITLLLKRGADINCPDGSGDTPLFAAAFCAISATPARLLLEHGANPLLTNLSGETALHRARNAETVALLLLAGVPVDAVDAQGYTPLLRALQLGRDASVVRVLLNAGAAIDVAPYTRPRETAAFLLTKPGGDLEERSLLNALRARNAAQAALSSVEDDCCRP